PTGTSTASPTSGRGTRASRTSAPRAATCRSATGSSRRSWSTRGTAGTPTCCASVSTGGSGSDHGRPRERGVVGRPADGARGARGARVVPVPVVQGAERRVRRARRRRAAPEVRRADGVRDAGCAVDQRARGLPRRRACGLVRGGAPYGVPAAAHLAAGLGGPCRGPGGRVGLGRDLLRHASWVPPTGDRDGAGPRRRRACPHPRRDGGRGLPAAAADGPDPGARRALRRAGGDVRGRGVRRGRPPDAAPRGDAGVTAFLADEIGRAHV